MLNQNLSVQQLRKIETQELTIHSLLEKGKRDPAEYSKILQAINDNCEIIIGPRVFLTLKEQLGWFRVYNGWLMKNYPDHAIPENAFQLEETLPLYYDQDWIFYCHGGDVVLTSKLAWEYASSFRSTRKEDYLYFENGYMDPAENEPARPSGFYIMARPQEDQYVIGAKFRDESVETVRKKLRLSGNWGMGCEGIQLLCITLQPYTEVMDGNKYPAINLPGLSLSLPGSKVSTSALYLHVDRDALELNSYYIDNGSNCYLHFHRGSGSLRQPQLK